VVNSGTVTASVAASTAPASESATPLGLTSNPLSSLLK
jgi:hypothetical protein